MNNNALFFTLAGMVPVCLLFFQVSALTGNTRALIPALAGMASAVVPAVAGTLLLQGGEMERGTEKLMTVLLFGLPLAVFAGMFAYFYFKRKAARQIPPRIRCIFALIPALAGLAWSWDLALGLAAVAFCLACLYMAVTGRVPVARPLGRAAVFLLNGVLFFSLLLEIPVDVPSLALLFMVLAVILLPACAYFAYRPLPPGKRHYPWELGADARWALLGLGMLVPFAVTRYVAVVFPVIAAACLACAIAGNTRAALPGAAGIAAGAGCAIWAIGLGSLHMGMALYVLAILLGLPLAVFGVCYFMVVMIGSATRFLPMPARAAMGGGAVLALAVFAVQWSR